MAVYKTSIDDCKKLLEYRSNKAGYNSYVSPDDFNLLWPKAEIRYFNKLYGNQNQYQPGRPVPPINYAETQKISESLSPFISNPLAITVDNAGKYTMPEDALHIDAITHSIPSASTQVEVVRVEKDRLANHLDSTYDAPSEEYPIYTEYNGYVQFYPTDLATANLTYLKTPSTGYWGYNIINSRPVYSPSLSRDPQWAVNDIDEIVYTALSDLAENMNDPQLGQWADKQSKTGGI